MIAFIGGAVALERQTINHLLENDATATASAWTELLAQNTDDLASIAAGNPPPADLRHFVDRVKSVARVFLYKVYDAHGTPRFVSDDLPEEADDTEDLAEHNPEAAEAIALGAPSVEVKTGEPPSRPAYYAEAYVPKIGKDGHVIGVVEAYIDQTAERAEFEHTFLVSASALGLLIAVAFGIPAGAWYRRRSDKEQAEARIAYLANFDALSGLANRSSLTNSLAGLLAEAGGRFVAVHCVDIDNFKDVNGRFGFAFGDQLIKWTAERLRGIAGNDDIVARLAGDEFAVIQAAPRNRADVEVFARKLSAAMAERLAFFGHELTPTVGVGIAMYPDHGRNAERLIRCAEMALAKGKSEGRGRIRFFSADLDTEAQDRLTLESAIEHALDTGGFALHFQPLYSEPNERLVGFEALARLPTADGGFIPPSLFIPAAERMGVIGRLGNWVLQEACAAATNWAEHLTVSVNLSAAQFGKENVSDVVATALAITGLKPGRLLLEITESLLLHDSESVMRELAHLKSLGPEIVMDDFGTGYSSLGYLWRFPFDKIKIDGSFMRALGTPDAPAEKIVRSVAGLGHMLGMRVCLEGVESEDHARYARAIGCDEVQGFYFGKPVAASQVAAIILRDFRRDHPASAPQKQAMATA
ncbi:MAG TPA: EAL domain-containing protein [Bauldia sp.]|nr:EAL domain-containing protein [Bauldia sp.]